MANWPASGDLNWNTAMLTYLAVEHNTDGTHKDLTYENLVVDDIKTKSPWFDVTHPDFGAVGNNSNDDTTAIQAALDAVRTAGGGTVYFPFGTYLISSELAINWLSTNGVNGADLNIIILGNRATIQSDSSYAGAMFSLLGDDSNIASRVKTVSIFDLQLKGKDTVGAGTNTIGFNLYGTFFVNLIRCKTRDIQKGVSAIATSECLIEDFRSVLCNYGIWGSGDSTDFGGTSQDFSVISIVRPVISQFYISAIHLKGVGLAEINGGTIAGPISGVLSGVTFETSGDAHTRSNKIDGTVFEFQESPSNGGIYVTNSSGSLVNSRNFTFKDISIQSATSGMKAFNIEESQAINFNNIGFSTAVTYDFIRTYNCQRVNVNNYFPFNALKNSYFINTSDVVINGYQGINPNPNGVLQQSAGIPYNYLVAQPHPVDGTNRDFAGRLYVKDTSGSGYLDFIINKTLTKRIVGQLIILKATVKTDAAARIQIFNNGVFVEQIVIDEDASNWVTRFLPVKIDSTYTRIDARFLTVGGSSSLFSEMDILISEKAVSLNLEGTQAPTIGPYERKDIILNRTPSAAGAPGWVCVSRVDTEMRVGASSGATTLEVDDTTGMTTGDICGVTLDNGTVQWSTITVTDGDTLEFGTTLDDDVAINNTIYTYLFKAMANLAS